LCLQTMLTIVPVILNQTDTDTFTSPALLTPAAAQRAYQIYVGDTVVTQARRRHSSCTLGMLGSAVRGYSLS